MGKLSGIFRKQEQKRIEKRDMAARGTIPEQKDWFFPWPKNDFKTKYAGSYFGTVWAFIQPVVTICVYWFVFGLALRGGADRGVPFVLWLVAGLVPWFFFSGRADRRDQFSSGI